MPRRALSRDEIEAFRERLCDAATGLFAERGYATVTFQALADAVGCSAMTPYRYFTGKEELLAAARAKGFRRLAEMQEETFRRHRAAARRVRALCSSYFRFAFENGAAFRIMFELHEPAGRSPGRLEAEIRRAYAPFRRAVADVVEEEGLREDPETVTHVIWAAAHGVVSLDHSGLLVLGRSAEDLIEPILRTVLPGRAARLR